jgi:EAL domain-containing protein (putative c-di-GMP-specific phosphodiesterase class I)
MTMPMSDLIRAHRPVDENWPGIVVDVPEEQIAADIPLAVDLARKLSEDRVSIAVDDFGRSYSSFVKHQNLPFAEIKLDRLFVTDCGSDKVNAPLCKNVIALAHSYRAAAVAIGIEKAADLKALVSMGCNVGQGYLLGQPMPEERLMSLLRQRAGVQGATAAASERRSA